MRKKIRIISLLLCLALIIGLLPISALASETKEGFANFTKRNEFSSNTFKDVKSNAWCLENVKAAYELGLMIGDSSTTFSPDGDVKISETITIAARLHSIFTYGKDVFEASSPWYDTYVDYALAHGIIKSEYDAYNVPATRAEFAYILSSALPASALEAVNKVADGKIPDVDSNAYYAEAVYMLYRAGVIIGNDAIGTFYPESHISRGEVAAIASRLAIPSLRKNIQLSNEPLTHNKNEDQLDEQAYTVTFDTRGGSTIKAQNVLSGQFAAKPEDPNKDGCTFIGWYCGETGFSQLFDFASPITGNVTIYAKWFDTTDTKDTDGDGLSDALEREFGSDPTNSDTDHDGISDYWELDWLNYDPTAADSDGNGIPDGQEDPDGDGLTNAEEMQIGTNPMSADTDHDYLSDGDEVRIYGTDTLNADTDDDGVLDSTEIELGTDPKVQEMFFNTVIPAEEPSQASPVTAGAYVTTDAAGAGTLGVQEVTAADNPLLSQSIPGYLGSAYSFTTKGEFQSAQLTFRYDSSLGEPNDDFKPTIYYFNEETGLLEEVPNQTLAEGVVSATVSHFSTYILLNKVAFDKVWETEIKTPQGQDDAQYTGIDIVFVIDSSGSMSSNDKNGLRLQAAKNFVDKLGEFDRAAVVDFDSSARVYQPFTSDHELLYKAIEKVNSSGGTSLSAGINLAIQQFTDSSYTRTDAYKYIIFLTDGDGSYNISYTTEAKDNNIVIYTIGLGSGVREATLKAIADGTGGKYYFASSADSLPDIYVDVSFETVDYTTDSNMDGISDYYTKLLNDGVLPLSTGSYDLIYVTETYGADCDDWDGDGLKNGDEIEICVVGTQVYAKMHSHPLLVDTDGDGFTDAQEQKNGTSPLKYTSDANSALNQLTDDSSYVYIEVANDRGLIANINAFFNWNKKDLAKALLIDYFYDYASQETISMNQEKISELKLREEYLKYAQSMANIMKAAKDICDSVDNISNMVEGIPDTGTAKEFIDEARTKKGKIEGASAQIRRSRATVLDAMNTSQLSDSTLLKTVMSDTDKALSTIEEFNELFEKYDTASVFEDFTSYIAKLSSDVAAAISTVKTIYDGYKYMKLDTGFKAISDGYNKYLKKNKSSSVSTYISVAVEIVDGGLEIWDTCNTYGKIKANRDAYATNIDLLNFIKENAYDEYNRVAAGEIAKIVEDESWKMYDQQIAAANTKTVALTTLSIVMDVCPYVNVAKKAFDIAKLTISITGLSNNANCYVSCRAMQAVSDGCKNAIRNNVEMHGVYFSYDTYVLSYMSQLAQARLVGEDFSKQRLKKGDLGAILGRWLTSTSKADIDSMYETLSGRIYDAAEALDLELSSNLPYYSTFRANSGAGGAGGR